MGKTAVFVLSALQQISPEDTDTTALILCHTRELAYQICHEFDRFKKYLPGVKTAVFYGGVPVTQNKETLKKETPHIVIGTPGRILQLAEEGDLKLGKVKYFILDECDKMLDTLGKYYFHLSPHLSITKQFSHPFAIEMRRDVQKIFKKTPHQKQVMMFSATLSDEIRPVCKKFMHNVSNKIVSEYSTSCSLWRFTSTMVLNLPSTD